MKRILCYLMAIFCVLCSLVYPVGAAEKSVIFSTSAKEVDVGETFDVYLNLSGFDDAKAITISNPEYDKAVFEWISGQWLYTNNATMKNFTCGSNVRFGKEQGYRGLYVTDKDCSINGRVAKLTFKVLKQSTQDEKISFSVFATNSKDVNVIGDNTITAAIVTFKKAENTGVTLSGKVTSYNPNNAVTVSLKQGNTVKYSTTIAATTGNGAITQKFTFSDVISGTYDLVVIKAGHLAYTIKGITVAKNDLDLTKSNKAYSNITLIAGDVNGDGYVNATDWSILWGDDNYLKSTASAKNKLTDINGDGSVNATDWSILWNDANYLKGKDSTTFAY